VPGSKEIELIPSSALDGQCTPSCSCSQLDRHHPKETYQMANLDYINARDHRLSAVLSLSPLGESRAITRPGRVC
jgi:hypothetical protein